MKNSSRLKIKKQTFTQHGVSYDAWLVYGYAPDGTRVRKQFQDRGEAQAWASTQEVRHMNLDVTSRPVLTRLDQEQLLTAELAISKLNGKGTLLDAVDHFIRTYRPVSVRILLKDGIKRFLEQKRVEGKVHPSHNLKVVGSNPTPAPNFRNVSSPYCSVV